MPFSSRPHPTHNRKHEGRPPPTLAVTAGDTSVLRQGQWHTCRDKEATDCRYTQIFEPGVSLWSWKLLSFGHQMRSLGSQLQLVLRSLKVFRKGIPSISNGDSCRSSPPPTNSWLHPPATEESFGLITNTTTVWSSQVTWSRKRVRGQLITGQVLSMNKHILEI